MKKYHNNRKRKLNDSAENKIQKVRKFAELEKQVSVDCSYMKKSIIEFWDENKNSTDDKSLKEKLKIIFEENLMNSHKEFFNKIFGKKTNISCIMFTGLFSSEDPRLGLMVHEALSDLFKINDIQYPYEQHKVMALKKEGLNIGEWSNGSGEINPHCDDLYEDNETDLLSITVSKDKLKIPTIFYMVKFILKTLSDQEIEKMLKIQATFLSGINVSGIIKTKTRNVLQMEDGQISIALDFRDDKLTGKRMLTRLRSDQKLIEKIKNNLKDITPIYSQPNSGTFFIVNNKKGLHARKELPIKKVEKELQLSDSGPPRLLYRSKGPHWGR